MPKKHTDYLFQLIDSLSKAEKRHFKLYSRRNTAGSDSLFLQLFDVLDKQKAYNEDTILIRIPGIKRRQLANVKLNLYKQLLISLRLLHRNQNIEIAVRENLDYAQILYSKGLYRHALNILERAKQKAIEIRKHNLAMEIIAFEKHIEGQHITRSIETKAEELSDQSSRLAEKVSRENQFSSLSLQLYGLYLKMGYARNEEENVYAIQFFKKQVPQFVESELSFFEKLYLYQSYVWLYNIVQDFPRQYRYALKWVNLFHEEEEMIPMNMPLYLKGLHNLLHTLYMTLQYDKFVNALRELDSLGEDGKFEMNKNSASLLILFRYVHRMNRHYLEGSFSKALEWIPELITVLDTKRYNWDSHREMVFYYRIACTYFSSGDNEKAIDYLNRIINHPNPELREDIHSFARILNLIAHFELGNDILVSYQLKSVYRFLSKMKELNEVHSEILHFVRRTPKMHRDELRDEFINLRNKLLEIKTHTFEKRSFLYLDIISWLESKIRDIPVQEVIQEKFRQLAKANDWKHVD